VAVPGRRRAGYSAPTTTRAGSCVSGPAPVGLDLAREYMERYSRSGRSATPPSVPASARASPSRSWPRPRTRCSGRRCARVCRPAGTVATFRAEGPGGGTWHLIQTAAGWELVAGQPPQPPACEVSATADGAIKLYAPDPAAPSLTRRGDPELADALSRAKAVLG
jgi:hypothetical protein